MANLVNFFSSETDQEKLIPASLHSLNLELVSSTTSIQILKNITWNLTTHVYAHLNPTVKVKAFPHYSYQF